MRGIAVVVAAAVVAFCVGCNCGSQSSGGGGGSGGGSSGGGTGGGGGDLDAGTVTVTVSGAYTGTRTFDSNIFSHSSQDNGTVYSILAMGAPFTTGGGIYFSNPPAVGSYGASSPGFNCLLSVSDNPNMLSWRVRVNDPGGSPDAGTCSAQLTSVSAGTPVTSVLTWYVVHGSINATMIADPNTTATGTVDVTYSF